MYEAKEQGFSSKYLTVILVIAGVIVLVILFIVFGGTAVSPDLRYFPT